MALIDDYLDALRARGHAGSTVTTYEGVLRRFHRDLPYGLDRAHTDELSAHVLRSHLSPAARALYRSVVVGFFQWACDPITPRLDHNPAVYLPRQRVPRRRPRPVTMGQLQSILSHAREPYRTWYLLAAYAGLRCIEISRLDRDDITDEWTWVRGKGDRERLVPTDPYIWDAVAGLPPGPVARRADGQRASARQVSWSGNRRLRRIGLAGVTMHRLRHWYGTHAHTAAGGDARVTQELLGHASLATTQIYVEVDAAAKLAAARAMPRILG